jgi:hypothetical protein
VTPALRGAVVAAALPTTFYSSVAIGYYLTPIAQIPATIAVIVGMGWLVGSLLDYPGGRR